jgi:hypothetical protein
MTIEPPGVEAAEDRYLLCSRKDGIGARLVNLVWTWRLARNAGLKTLCFWPPLDPYYGESNGVGDLLDVYALAASELRRELTIIDARPIDHLRPEPTMLDPGKRHDAQAYAVTPRFGSGARSHAIPLIDTGMGPLLAHGERSAKATAEARALLARLPLTHRLQQALRLLDKSHNLQRTIAVHVRRGDIVEVLRGACEALAPDAQEKGSLLDRYTEHFFRGCAPAPSYLRLVRPLLKQGYSILFFSDTPGEAEPFLKRFEYKMTLARDLGPDNLTGIQRALFEIHLMSRCHTIVAAKSTFSILASLIGGAALVDARRETKADEWVRAYRRAVRYDYLAPEVKAVVSQVLVRKLQENRLLELWSADGEEILRLLAAA